MNITSVCNREILVISYSEVILTIVRLWEVDLTKAGCDMVCGNTVSKPGLVLNEAGIGSNDHCCKFGRWMLLLIGIVHPMVTI